MKTVEQWRPGSFTKNFSWGDQSAGLQRLHEAIKVGFDDKVEDVHRDEFRARLRKEGIIDYIPSNFFLFCKIADDVDYVVADELVFQAITNTHSSWFDKLAVFALNFSYVGVWKRAARYQRRPSLWAFHYIAERVARELDWNTKYVSANDIEKYVSDDARYKAKTARKLATNLNHIYEVGKLREFSTPKVERWWVDALFLALDRVIEDHKLDGIEIEEREYGRRLINAKFPEISGKHSFEKQLATKHLTTLFTACGGRKRFEEEYVRERTELKLPEVQWLLANDQRPQGALHPTNPNILKSIPRTCAMLARYAGFEIIDADELAEFDAAKFVRKHTIDALTKLAKNSVVPITSSDELMKLTRDK